MVINHDLVHFAGLELNHLSLLILTSLTALSLRLLSWEWLWMSQSQVVHCVPFAGCYFCVSMILHSEIPLSGTLICLGELHLRQRMVRKAKPQGFSVSSCTANLLWCDWKLDCAECYILWKNKIVNLIYLKIIISHYHFTLVVIAYHLKTEWEN